jgi:hypothetical protein
MKRYGFEKVKEEIINILQSHDLAILRDKKYFLFDDDGEKIDFQNEKEYILCSCNNIKLTLKEGEILLGVETKADVNPKWISQLYLAKQAQEKIQRLIDIQNIYYNMSE